MKKIEAALPTKVAMEKVAIEFAEILDSLRAKGIPMLSAVVMAGDLQSMRRVDEMVASKEAKPVDVVWFIGSYARFDWATKNLSRSVLLRMLPRLWVASDPDDSKPEYLELWHQAFIKRGKIVTDGKPLPQAKTMYRGQVGNTLGISWTLDRSVAEKFAKTGGGRGVVRGGKVLKRKFNRHAVLAYLTSRGEQEVIIDLLYPRCVSCGNSRSNGSAKRCKTCYHEAALSKRPVGPEEQPTMTIEVFTQKWMAKAA